MESNFLLSYFRFILSYTFNVAIGDEDGLGIAEIWNEKSVGGSFRRS